MGGCAPDGRREMAETSNRGSTNTRTVASGGEFRARAVPREVSQRFEAGYARRLTERMQEKREVSVSRQTIEVKKYRLD
jgi:hypothetical protein